MTRRGTEIVTTAAVHDPVGPYSHAIRIAPGSEWLYVSGQVSMSQDGELVGAGDLAAQIEQVFANLQAVLNSSGYVFGDVVKTTTFLVNAHNVDSYRELRTEHYRKHFTAGSYPTSTLVVVERLANEAFLLEIEAVAAKAPAS
jgi:enamine deaminase RidA (YjgF/YER057c/UK114 family)